MSDHEHVEPENPPADAFATRLFVVSMVGILAFITIVFVFVL